MNAHHSSKNLEGKSDEKDVKTKEISENNDVSEKNLSENSSKDQNIESPLEAS